MRKSDALGRQCRVRSLPNATRSRPFVQESREKGGLWITPLVFVDNRWFSWKTLRISWGQGGGNWGCAVGWPRGVAWIVTAGVDGVIHARECVWTGYPHGILDENGVKPSDSGVRPGIHGPYGKYVRYISLQERTFRKRPRDVPSGSRAHVLEQADHRLNGHRCDNLRGFACPDAPAWRFGEVSGLRYSARELATG